MNRFDRLLRAAHNWTGLVVSLALAAIALSGAVLVWKADWLRLTQPGAAAVVAIDADAFGRAAEAAERAFGAEAVRSVTFAGPRFGLHEVYLRDGGGAYLAPDGVVADRWRERERAVDILFDLHHRLFAGEAGTKLTGVIGFVGSLLILTGLYLWWPARRLFEPRAAPRSFKRAHMVAAHRDLGVLVAPVALVSLLTGAAMALPDVAKPALGAMLGRPAPGPTFQGLAAADVDWALALDRAQGRFPDAAPRMAVWPASGKPASVRLRQPAEWHANGRTQVYLDPATAALVAVVDPQTGSRSDRLFNVFWPVHAGKVGGPLWRIALCASGLGLAALALYGAESHRRRLFPRRRPSAASLELAT